MLAKTAAGLPQGDDFLFEPKSDGFRAIVFRTGGPVLIQSRVSKPFDHYFRGSNMPEGHNGVKVFAYWMTIIQAVQEQHSAKSF